MGGFQEFTGSTAQQNFELRIGRPVRQVLLLGVFVALTVGGAIGYVDTEMTCD